MSDASKDEDHEQRLREMNEALLVAAVRQQELAEQAQAAEAALRESEGRYRAALRVGRIGSWEVDLTTGIRLWSTEGMDLFGLDLPGGQGRVGGDWDEWRAALHSDEWALPARVAEALERDGELQIEYRIVRPDGRTLWLSGSAEVVARDGQGRVTRFLNVAADVTEARLAVAALQESEERFRSFAENSADTLWIVDLETGQLDFLSPAFERIWGESRALVSADIGRWRELVYPEDREQASQGMPRLVAGEPYGQDYRIVRPSDGAVRWIQDTGFPMRDPDGRVRRVGGIAKDVTDRKVAEAAVRASRRQLRALVDGIPQLVWRATPGGEWVWSSPQWSAFTGLSEEASRGRGWLQALHPDDRETAEVSWLHAEAAGGFAVECRICGFADSRYRWFQTRAMPVLDEAGTVIEWLGTSTDIDDIRGLQEYQKLLLAELQHRVRNTLAVVRSIARRTAQTSDTVEDYAMHLDGRLSAFARTQAAVTRDPAAGVSLDHLIAEELVAYGAHEKGSGAGNQVRIAGPEIRLTPKAAETLGLAIHELATNAVKYGALSPGKDGRVVVEWHVLDGPSRQLNLTWIEDQRNGSMLTSPRRRGFGTELLERTLKFELKARTSLDFAPSGLRCTIDIPLTDRIIWSGPRALSV